MFLQLPIYRWLYVYAVALKYNSKRPSKKLMGNFVVPFLAVNNVSILQNDGSSFGISSWYYWFETILYRRFIPTILYFGIVLENSIYNKKNPHIAVRICLEAPPRFGLGVKLLQSSALPLGYGAIHLPIYSTKERKKKQGFCNSFIVFLWQYFSSRQKSLVKVAILQNLMAQML